MSDTSQSDFNRFIFQRNVSSKTDMKLYFVETKWQFLNILVLYIHCNFSRLQGFKSVILETRLFLCVKRLAYEACFSVSFVGTICNFVKSVNSVFQYVTLILTKKVINIVKQMRVQDKLPRKETGALLTKERKERHNQRMRDYWVNIKTHPS